MQTIRTFLQQQGITLADTVYQESDSLDFPIPAKGKWEIRSESLEKQSFQKIASFQNELNQLKQADTYQQLKRELTRADLPKEQKKQLRERKKEWKQQYHTAAFAKIFHEAEVEQIFSVTYKQGANAADFTELSAVVPQWQGADYAGCCQHPWFVSDLSKLKKMLSSGEPIGVEGGSCLIGSDEMLFHFRMQDGNVRTFDFNTMQEIHHSAEELTETVSTALWEFVSQEQENIIDIFLECPKTQLTIDEYQSLEYLFLLAHGLHAKLVVTIPDMSYEKTFIQLFKRFPRRLYEPLHEAFGKELERLRNLNIRWIAYFEKKYDGLETVIFHGGRKDLCQMFCEKREPFLDAYAKKHLTARKEMEDALMDYICMPAMPHYLWGVREVIEVNRMEEYPSVEKCLRMHKSKMHLHSMLYPQQISKNGRTSSFYADRKNKIYVNEEKIRTNEDT